MTIVSAGDFEARLSETARAAFLQALERWDAERGGERLWQRDASLWTGGEEASWLGWLEPGAGCDLDVLARFGADVAARGVRFVVLIGMGGSSLGAELIVRAVRRPGAPELYVLDTTDPDQILAADARLDHARSLFVVASKSGTTIESVSLEEFFWSRLVQEGILRPGETARAGPPFVAITDPGTALERRARERGYRVFHGVPEIGGRWSALSPFGLVPAAALGGDLDALLLSARGAAARSGADVPAADNPAVALGLLLATLAAAGRDKLTLFPPAELDLLGPWLEQLLAESTGKLGRGILPVAGEERLDAPAYGSDRVLVEWGRSIRSGAREYDVSRSATAGPDARSTAAVDRVTAAATASDAYGAGDVVHAISLPLATAGDVGAEILRWELATAVAGARLAINPFDQPDVEAAKVAAKRLVAMVGAGTVEPRGVELHASRAWRWHGASGAQRPSRGAGETPAAILRAHLEALAPGDFFALLAYLPREGAVEAALQRMRMAVAARQRVATTLGFGPRYLHSTGQYMKGGPNRGVYLFVTRQVDDDLAIPGQDIGFGALEAAQAQGDIEVLAERGRRVLQVELLDEIEPTLDALAALVEQVLRNVA